MGRLSLPLHAMRGPNGPSRTRNRRMAQHTDIDPSALGPNMWLIDEMYRRFREDPDAVGPAWKEFFEGFRPALGGDGAASTLAQEAGEALRVASPAQPGESLRAASPHPTPRSAPPPAPEVSSAPEAAPLPAEAAPVESVPAPA